MPIYSDIDLQDPGSYYGGFKEGRVEKFGEASRELSHPYSGDWQGSTFAWRVSDTRRDIRQMLASNTERFWTEPLAVRMTTRANRAALGPPYTVFVGPIINAQPSGPLAYDFTLGDMVSASLLSDRMQVPWRLVRDGFLDQLDAVSEQLDLDQPEPIIYGQHLRVPDVDVASPEGFEITPPLLGTRTIAGVQYHVWLICGHAVSSIPRIRIDIVATAEGTDWLIPTQANHTALFGTSYEDFTSSTFGTTRRYTLLYGVVGNEEPDAVAAGDRVLTVAVHGIETAGDGSGDLITDRFLQYEHFLVNFVANRGAASYQSGAWLTNPTWALMDGAVEIIDSGSFATASAIGLERLPTTGYIGAAVIGGKSGDQSSVLRWISDWNRSCGCQFGVSRQGQLGVTLLHPTQAIKDGAPLYTDATEILKGSFGTGVGYQDQANRIPFRTDYEQRSAQWKTNENVSDLDAITNYAREMLSERREYVFAPGITMSNHLAVLELRRRVHPPRTIRLSGTIGPDPVTGDSIAYRDLGDYIRYEHFAAVAEPGEIRLAQVQSVTVDVGARTATIEALDCDDLIDFDVYEGSPA